MKTNQDKTTADESVPNSVMLTRSASDRLIKRSTSLGKFSNVMALFKESNVSSDKSEDDKKKKRRKKSNSETTSQAKAKHKRVNDNEMISDDINRSSIPLTPPSSSLMKNLTKEDKNRARKESSQLHVEKSKPKRKKKRPKRDLNKKEHEKLHSTPTASLSSKPVLLDPDQLSDSCLGVFDDKLELTISSKNQTTRTNSAQTQSQSSSTTMISDETGSKKAHMKKKRVSDTKHHGSSKSEHSVSTMTSNTKSGKEHLRVMIIGSPGIGKTSLCIRFCENHFHAGVGSPQTTIGHDIYHKDIALGDTLYSLLLYDFMGDPFGRSFTSDGSHKGRSLTMMAEVSATLRSIDCLIVAYDASIPRDMRNVFFLLCSAIASIPDGLPIILVGTKYDLLRENERSRYLSTLTTERTKDIKNILNSNEVEDLPLFQAYGNYLTSAKTNENVEFFFTKVIEMASDFKTEYQKEVKSKSHKHQNQTKERDDSSGKWPLRTGDSESSSSSETDDCDCNSPIGCWC